MKLLTMMRLLWQVVSVKLDESIEYASEVVIGDGCRELVALIVVCYFCYYYDYIAER